MNLYQNLGTLSGRESPDELGRLAASRVPWSPGLFTTYQDGVWSVSAAGTAPNGRTLIHWSKHDPDYRLIDTLNSGMFGTVSWSAWRLVPYNQNPPYPTAAEAAAAASRLIHLRALIRQWQADRAAHPTATMRPIDDLLREEAALEKVVASAGSFHLAAYMGFAKRWARDQYIY